MPNEITEIYLQEDWDAMNADEAPLPDFEPDDFDVPDDSEVPWDYYPWDDEYE